MHRARSAATRASAVARRRRARASCSASGAAASTRRLPRPPQSTRPIHDAIRQSEIRCQSDDTPISTRMPRSANGIHRAHGLTARSSADGGETIAGSAANRSASFQSGASVHALSVNVAVMTTSCAPAASWTPSMLACWPSTLNPAATLELVRTRNTPGARARIVPRIVRRVTASGGRSSADGGSPIVAEGRLKNHTGNSSSVRYGLVVMAVHRGSAASQSVRASQLLAAPVPSITYGRDGSTRVHQPSCTRAAEPNAFQPSSRRITTRARRVRNASGVSQSSSGSDRPKTNASAAVSKGAPSRRPVIRDGHQAAMSSSKGTRRAIKRRHRTGFLR